MLEICHQYQGVYNILGPQITRMETRELINGLEKAIWVFASSSKTTLTTNGKRKESFDQTLVPWEQFRIARIIEQMPVLPKQILDMEEWSEVIMNFDRANARDADEESVGGDANFENFFAETKVEPPLMKPGQRDAAIAFNMFLETVKCLSFCILCGTDGHSMEQCTAVDFLAGAHDEETLKNNCKVLQMLAHPSFEGELLDQLLDRPAEDLRSNKMVGMLMETGIHHQVRNGPLPSLDELYIDCLGLGNRPLGLQTLPRLTILGEDSRDHG